MMLLWIKKCLLVLWLSFEVVQSQVDLRQHANMHIMGRASFDGKDSNLPHPLIGGAEISKPIEVKGNEAAKGDVNHKATSNNVVPNTGGMVGGNIDVSDETEEEPKKGGWWNSVKSSASKAYHKIKEELHKAKDKVVDFKHKHFHHHNKDDDSDDENTQDTSKGTGTSSVTIPSVSVNPPVTVNPPVFVNPVSSNPSSSIHQSVFVNQAPENGVVQNGFNFDSFSSVKFPQRIVSPAPTTTFNTNIADKSMSFQPLPQSRSATVSPVIIQSENSPLMHTSNVQFNTPSQQIYLDKVQKVVTPVKSVEEQKPAVLVKHVEETKTIIAVDTSSSPPSVQQIPAPVQPIVAPVETIVAPVQPITVPIQPIAPIAPVQPIPALAQPIIAPVQQPIPVPVQPNPIPVQSVPSSTPSLPISSTTKSENNSPAISASSTVPSTPSSPQDSKSDELKKDSQPIPSTPQPNTVSTDVSQVSSLKIALPTQKIPDVNVPPSPIISSSNNVGSTTGPSLVTAVTPLGGNIVTGPSTITEVATTTVNGGISTVTSAITSSSNVNTASSVPVNPNSSSAETENPSATPYLSVANTKTDKAAENPKDSAIKLATDSEKKSTKRPKKDPESDEPDEEEEPEEIIPTKGDKKSVTAAKDQKAEVQPASTTPKDPKTPAQGEDLPDSADVPTPSKGKNLSKGRKNLSGEEED